MTEQKRVGQNVGTDDRELLSRAQSGDRSAFEELVARHRDSVYGFGLQMTRSEEEAAQIAQGSFLSGCLHLEEFRSEEEFAAWVNRIAATRVLMGRRDRSAPRRAGEKLAPPKLDGGLARNPTIDWSCFAEEKTLSAELRGAIQDAVDRLPEAHRDVFLLNDLAGLRCEQIAEICGEPIAAIKARLHQARLTLREAIDRFYRES